MIMKKYKEWSLRRDYIHMGSNRFFSQYKQTNNVSENDLEQIETHQVEDHYLSEWLVTNENIEHDSIGNLLLKEIAQESVTPDQNASDLQDIIFSDVPATYEFINPMTKKAEISPLKGSFMYGASSSKYNQREITYEFDPLAPVGLYKIKFKIGPQKNSDKHLTETEFTSCYRGLQLRLRKNKDIRFDSGIHFKTDLANHAVYMLADSLDNLFYALNCIKNENNTKKASTPTESHVTTNPIDLENLNLFNLPDDLTVNNDFIILDQSTSTSEPSSTVREFDFYFDSFLNDVEKSNQVNDQDMNIAFTPNLTDAQTYKNSHFQSQEKNTNQEFNNLFDAYLNGPSLRDDLTQRVASIQTGIPPVTQKQTNRSLKAPLTHDTIRSQHEPQPKKVIERTQNDKVFTYTYIDPKTKSSKKILSKGYFNYESGKHNKKVFYHVISNEDREYQVTFKSSLFTKHAKDSASRNKEISIFCTHLKNKINEHNDNFSELNLNIEQDDSAAVIMSANSINNLLYALSCVLNNGNKAKATNRVINTTSTPSNNRTSRFTFVPYPPFYIETFDSNVMPSVEESNKYKR